MLMFHSSDGLHYQMRIIFPQVVKQYGNLFFLFQIQVAGIVGGTLKFPSHILDLIQVSSKTNMTLCGFWNNISSSVNIWSGLEFLEILISLSSICNICCTKVSATFSHFVWLVLLCYTNVWLRCWNCFCIAIKISIYHKRYFKFFGDI